MTFYVVPSVDHLQQENSRELSVFLANAAARTAAACSAQTGWSSIASHTAKEVVRFHKDGKLVWMMQMELAEKTHQSSD